MFIAEWTTHNFSQSGVQEFTTGGAFIDSIGTYTSGPSPIPRTFWMASGIAVGPDGRIYITDTGSVRTQVFANDLTYLFQWPSQGGAVMVRRRAGRINLRFRHLERARSGLRLTADAGEIRELGPAQGAVPMR